ncbi:OsmC family protein [Marinimicrococcus flavescens]|uniref:OsmC family protein n=1 Tax=Marinimicrococcus flavescens TaxID=3031815 RepID=A0AAP3XPP3_9PROT|nr:OsmC family protein [Marinimicrococcus flavescens]
MGEHRYAVTVEWTGNSGRGTSSYDAYSRSHEITVSGKHVIAGSSDPHFRGDPHRYNPEELLVASLSACHMLWYLHLCADAGLHVRSYLDRAAGSMTTSGGGGRFTEVVLRPRVELLGESDLALAERLHEEAHARCFVASSVNFPVRIEPTIARSGR